MSLLLFDGIGETEVKRPPVRPLDDSADSPLKKSQRTVRRIDKR